jgi:hypothetical protein
MDGGHDDRRAGRYSGSRAEELGAVHVRVDEVDLLPPQPRGKRADGHGVIGLVQDLDGHAQPSQPLDCRAGGEREGAHVVAGSVQAE